MHVCTCGIVGESLQWVLCCLNVESIVTSTWKDLVPSILNSLQVVHSTSLWNVFIPPFCLTPISNNGTEHTQVILKLYTLSLLPFIYTEPSIKRKAWWYEDHFHYKINIIGTVVYHNIIYNNQWRIRGDAQGARAPLSGWGIQLWTTDARAQLYY